VQKRTEEEIEALFRQLDQHEAGGLNPDAEQLRTLVAAGYESPLQFVNLLAYHEFAQYPEGHELAHSGLSGAGAYGRYGIVALDHVTRRGGRLTLYNDVAQVLIGIGAPWHQVAIMEYPDTEAFLDMICDPEYEIVKIGLS
jgi:uncharacterized protein (DUF1330 family)